MTSDDHSPEQTQGPQPDGSGELGHELQELASQRDAERTLVGDKWFLAWGITLDRFGVGNVHDSAKLLYAMLYDPENTGVQPDERYPGREDVAEARLMTTPQTVPSPEEFIQTVRHTMDAKMSYGDSLHEGAEAQLQDLMRMGFVRIWTEGDMEDTADKIGQLAPGSRQQLYKVAEAVGPIRREVAHETDPPRRLQDVLDASISTNKKAFLDDICVDLKDRGVEDVVILEDRSANLIAAAEAATRHGLNPIPIWVRQGRQRNKVPAGHDLGTDVTSLNAVDSISDVSAKLADLGYPRQDQTIASLVDFDGVLMDDTKRTAAMKEVVVRELEQKGWI